MRLSILTVPVRRVGAGEPLEQDVVAVEEPMQIRVGGVDVAVTMRTPGNDVELAAGYLFAEGVIGTRGDVRAINEDASVVSVELAGAADLERLTRYSYQSSSCGVCGKASLDLLAAEGCVSPQAGEPKVEARVIHGLPGALREHQRVFEYTGGLHAAALFRPDGELVAVREDVGRHNAVDKLIGFALMEGMVPLAGYGLLLSGRVSFELVQKAVKAGVPVIAAVGAPSSLAVQTARRFGVTLAGFVRNGSFNLYAGEERVIAAALP